MSSILDLLQGQLGDDTVRQIGSQLGVAPQQASAAIGAALPMLIGALSRNASTGAGAESLLGALARDHDGSVLDNLGSLLGQGPTRSGLGALGHIFGGRENAVAGAVGRSTGLDAQTVTSLLAMLAPMVLGALGKAQRSRGLDAGGLSEMLGGEIQRAQSVAPNAMGALGALLDADGDGNVMDDLAEKGAGLLGALLRGR